MKLVLRLFAAVLVCATAAPRLHADAYDAKPKLVVIMVWDQFRGDYLDRYRADFKAPNGWNLFLKKGAHFTDCYYDYANLITAAGHSTIGTGAYTSGHGIPGNGWFEPLGNGKFREVSSVDDYRYRIVGEAPGVATSPGVSPHKELATTLGDELVLASGGRSRVYGVSLKDRAAVLTSGHATKAAFWTDHDNGRWLTSTYWMPQLPAWAEKINETAVADARKQAGIPEGSFYEKVGRTAAGVAYQLNFAKALIANEHLGNNPDGVTDMITISISSTDINGHQVGPDDPSQKKLIVDSDALLNDFFNFLDKQVGLKNVLIGLSGDHGVGLTAKSAEAMGMPALNIQQKTFLAALEQKLDKRFPKKAKGKYVLGLNVPFIQLNQEQFEQAGVSEEQAENAAREELMKVFAEETPANPATPFETRQPEPAIATHIYTVSEMREGRLPNTQYGRLIAHSYSPYIGWGIHVNYGAYQFPGNLPATHFTGNSYDRHVPLDLYGAAIVPGTYHGVVAPVDIAATFASLLRINRPSAAVGNVLTQAIKPEAAGSTWVKEAPVTSKKR
ncbi:MAG: alkaline phosphatase family protein [Acidobacteria bacterium]|nr:alkaline phosphatase family protein [Acidobacteriota bacterium]